VIGLNERRAATAARDRELRALSRFVAERLPVGASAWVLEWIALHLPDTERAALREAMVMALDEDSEPVRLIAEATLLALAAGDALARLIEADQASEAVSDASAERDAHVYPNTIPRAQNE